MRCTRIIKFSSSSAQVERHDPDVIILHVTEATHLDSGFVSCIATTTTKCSSPTTRSSSIKCTTQLFVVETDEGTEEDDNSSSSDYVSESDSSYCYRISDDRNMKKEPALILKGPSDVTALVGDRVLLKAVYMGRPEPTVRWCRAVSCFIVG